METIADVYMVACGLFDRTEQPADKQDTSGPAPKQNANKLGGGGDPDHAKKVLSVAQMSSKHKQAWAYLYCTCVSCVCVCVCVCVLQILRFAKSMVCAVGCLRDPIGEPVQLRVGIHSGPIMTGVVGRRMPRFCCFGVSGESSAGMHASLLLEHQCCLHRSYAASPVMKRLADGS